MPGTAPAQTAAAPPPGWCGTRSSSRTAPHRAVARGAARSAARAWRERGGAGGAQERVASGSAAGYARLIKEAHGRPVSRGGLVADSRVPWAGGAAPPRAASARGARRRQPEGEQWEADVPTGHVSRHRWALGSLDREWAADGPEPHAPSLLETPCALAWCPGLGAEDYPGASAEECPAHQPDLCDSRTLLGKVLQQDPYLVDRLRDRRTSRGVGLARCIKPGLDHRASAIAGAVAGDAECYRTFRELFDPLVGMCHPAAAAAAAPEAEAPAPADHIFRLPIDPRGSHALSVRVEASRNLEHFRFPTACDRAERIEVERILVRALSHLSDADLRGQYYPLRGSGSHAPSPGGMSPEDESSLAERGLLFKAPESPERLSSGVGRHWPEARGAFVADSGQLVAWCNEEDHLKVVSLQQGGDLRAAYGRFACAVGHLDGQWKSGYRFARSAKFGYLTACPCSLGVRGSVVLRLPLLASRPGFGELCARVALQARWGQGPYGVVELSSPNQLAPDIDNMNSLIVGCSRLVRLEEALESGADAPRAPLVYAMLPGLGLAEPPGFPTGQAPEAMPDLSENATMVASVLTKAPGLWSKLKGLRTGRGMTFAKCIKPGMDCPQLKIMGVCAGDEESYDTFADIIGKVMELRHAAFTLGRAQPSRVLHSRVSDAQVDPGGGHAVSVRVQVSRNLSWFRFPTLCSAVERHEVERLLVQALGRLQDFEARGEYFPLPHSHTQHTRPDGMSAEEAQELRSCAVLLAAPSAPHVLAAGSGRQWPEARGVFAAASRRLAAWVNGEDHLLLTSLQPGGDLRQAFGRLCAALADVEAALRCEHHRFAFHKDFGHLTSDPSNLGVTACVALRLPRLSSEPGFKRMCQELGLQARPLVGTQEKSLGVWEVENRDKIGPPEPEIVSGLIEGCARLVREERELESQAGEGPGADADAPRADRWARAPQPRERGLEEVRVDATPRSAWQAPPPSHAAELARATPRSRKLLPASHAHGAARPRPTPRCSQPSVAAAPVAGRRAPTAQEMADLDEFRLSARARGAPVDGAEGGGALGVFAALDGLGPWDYPGFPSGECPPELPDLSGHRSLMARAFLAHPGMYGRLRARCTRLGVTLARCVKPGLDDKVARGVGAWAGDADCYEAFGELFDQVVELCHGPRERTGGEAAGPEEKVTSTQIDPSGGHVVSVLAKSCRNLDGFRFPPACGREERREVESALVAALSHLEGEELRSTYYPLPGSTSQALWPTGMSLEESRQLEREGLLFGPPSSVEKLSAGIGRDWPEARGVFAASSRKVVAWCNEQDHLLLVSTQPGDGLQEAFQRHREVLVALEQALKGQGHRFARSRRLGYLTSCPTDLGLSLIVTMRLPRLSGQPGFGRACHDLGLTPRAVGRRGEPGVWEFTNAVRLGKNEEMIVNRTVEACARLIQMEQGLEPPARNTPGSPGSPEIHGTAAKPFAAMPGLGEEDYPGFPTSQCPPGLPTLQNRTVAYGILQRNPDIYRELSCRAPTSNGVSFARCVKPCMDEPELPTVGAVAGDAESYRDFGALFDLLVDELHGPGAPEAAPSEWRGEQTGVVSDTPIDPGGQCALSVRIRCSRNLDGFCFPPALGRADRGKVEHLLGSALLLLGDADCAGSYFPLDCAATTVGGASVLDAEARRELDEGRLLLGVPESVDQLASGLGRHWPESRGVFAANSRCLAAWVNERDHLQLVSLQPGGDLAAAWGRLARALQALEASLAERGAAFAHDARRGWLTSCPGDLGLHASVVLRLPRLSSRPGILRTCADLGLRALRVPDRSGDCAWEVSSVQKLGPPAQVLEALRTGCAILARMEAQLADGEEPPRN